MQFSHDKREKGKSVRCFLNNVSNERHEKRGK